MTGRESPADAKPMRTPLRRQQPTPTCRPIRWRCTHPARGRRSRSVSAAWSRYGRRSLVIPKGAIVSLIGPNGAGKTTFFNIVAGILDPTAGEIAFRGRKMVARPVRPWLEPILWFIPSLATLVIGWLLSGSFGLAAIEVGILVAVAALVFTLLLAIVRPEWYSRLLVRLGVFKSARPNDMVQAGIGRTFQNIRLFQNMTAARERARRDAHEAPAEHARRLAVYAAAKSRGESGAETSSRAAHAGRSAWARRRAGAQPSIRRPEAPRGRAGPRQRPRAAAYWTNRLQA